MHNLAPALVPVVTLVVMLAFDLQNLIACVKRALPLAEQPSSDYTLVVPLYGDPDILTNMAFLAEYKANVLLVLNTTNDAMTEFADRQEADGWRVVRTHFAKRPRVSRLWQAGLDAVETAYAMRVDADTVSSEDPGRAVRALEQSGADYASVKVLVKAPGTLAGHLQAAEYAMSMQARHFRPWMTSGACILGRTAALRHILSVHSHWHIGEDVEQGIIAKHYRMRVVHIAYKAYTDAPVTFRALFRQRRLWWAGSVRQSFMNFDQMVRFPAYLSYYLLLVYAGFFLRGRLLAATPLDFLMTLPIMLVAYVVITSIANYQVWSKWFCVFPLYSLLQVLVMPGIGVIEFVRTAVKNRSTGRYLIGWRREKWTLEDSLKGIA